MEGLGLREANQKPTLLVCIGQWGNWVKQSLCIVYNGRSKSKGQSQGELPNLGIGTTLRTEGSMVVLSSFLNLLHSSVI